MQDIRWKQRFENWQAAYSRLQEAANAHTQTEHSAIIQMALIKGFEMTFELSWKTMKDYLSYSGIEANAPRDIIKHAFATNIIADGQVWIDMLDDRNLMAHTYDEARAKKAIEHICTRYLIALQELRTYFQARLA